MANKDIWDIALQDRKTKLEELQNEQAELDKKLKVSYFEEDMYYNLSDKKYKYKDIFEKKRVVSDNKYKQLEKDMEALGEEVKILTMEIEYIEGLINNSTN